MKQSSQTNWRKLRSLTEAQIVKAAKSDPDAKPLTQSELKGLKRVRSVKQVSVNKIRRKLNLSQEEFAHYFGVSKRTIQEWEQARRKPTAIARNFLRVIEREPKAVQRALSRKD